MSGFAAEGGECRQSRGLKERRFGGGLTEHIPFLWPALQRLEHLLLADRNELTSVRLADFGFAKAVEEYVKPDGEALAPACTRRVVQDPLQQAYPPLPAPRPPTSGFLLLPRARPPETGWILTSSVGIGAALGAVTVGVLARSGLASDQAVR